MTRELPFRQIHLDFHTHGSIEGIGADFDPDEFAETLQQARVNSVNLFGLGHHGYLYYQSEALEDCVHPHLERNLLPQQIEACHARGIEAPVYVSLGWNALLAHRHPEWLVRKPNQSVNIDAFSPGFYNPMCVNSPYGEWLKTMVSDLFEHMPVDGLWFDICKPRPCACKHCVDGMLDAGIDPDDEQNRREFAHKTMMSYRLEMTEHVRTLSDDCLVFYNCGHVGPNDRPSLDAFTHLELESLPYGWGYHYFPIVSRYARNLKDEYLGMTGKFHTSWGDFHSFKNEPQLACECFTMLSLGAKCCIGDQLHPRGKICPDTYDLIGAVYEGVEQREPWCTGVEPVVDIAVITSEGAELCWGSDDLPKGLMGACRMLQEEGAQFDVVDPEMDLSEYSVVVLPDDVTVDGEYAGRLNTYVDSGGALIASHRSGLDPAGEGFAVEMGVEYQGEDEYITNFVHPGAEIQDGLRDTEYVMYKPAGSAVKAAEGTDVLADNVAPYFNRTWQHYCSHRQAPSTGEVYGPAVTRAGNVIYFAKPLFSIYNREGARWMRQMVENTLAQLLPEPAVRVDGPRELRVTLNEQPREQRRILHLLYYVPVRNNEQCDTIEDVIPLHDVEVAVRADDAVEHVTLQPQGKELPFEVQDGYVHMTVPRLEGHQMVEIE